MTPSSPHKSPSGAKRRHGVFMKFRAYVKKYALTICIFVFLVAAIGFKIHQHIQHTPTIVPRINIGNDWYEPALKIKDTLEAKARLFFASLKPNNKKHAKDSTAVSTEEIYKPLDSTKQEKRQ